MDDLTDRYSFLVSKYAVSDHIQSIMDSIETDNKYNEGFVDGLEFCIGTLSTAPTVQFKNVGEWIPHRSIFGGLGEKVYTCNKCGYNIGFRQENFCSNCGAKMVIKNG